MRLFSTALVVVFIWSGAGVAAYAQEGVYTAWVMRNGDGPQPFFFGYGRTLDLAEKIAHEACGPNCRILKSGPGCVSITMANQQFYPRGCGGRTDPPKPVEETLS